ncbi:MAG: DNA polymerase III subunit gamma/tau [Microbacterium sp.]
MTARPDDDALSWEGDDDPTLQVDARPAAATPEPQDAAPPALPEGFTAVGRGSEEVERLDADGTVVMPGERAPIGNAALVSLGVLGGVYLLFTIGWVIGGLRLQGRAQYLVADVMFQGSFWLAALAAPLWFATTWLLTRRARPWVRFAVLVAGAALLVPWPFIMTGTVGQ